MATDKTLLIEGADDAILGFIQRCGQPPVAIYDNDRLIEHFMAQGMTFEEAVEWIDYNVIGAWVGEGTPAVLVRATREDLDELLGTDKEDDDDVSVLEDR